MGTRAILAPAGLILVLLAMGGYCEDAVAANVGHHTMSRMAALLSPSECRQLQEQLMRPNKDTGGLEQTRRDSRHFRIPRQRPGCSEALRRWLETEGEVTSWDQLTRSLRQIGRPDIARELGKNLNQDRSLELRRNVEEYGRSVQHLTSSLLLQDEHQGMERSRRDVGDIGDLHFVRRPPPPYTRSPLGWVGPVLSGIVWGFVASVLISVISVFSCHWALGSVTS
ncbi:transmembrane and death domain protein 1 [Cyrtonyx montezumae]|uniref:transmembrane and death domain protein 1 n=1 Tax=Cyrtonyx montezumae TaxID=9017 RepID=UPI0032DA3652